MDNIRKYIEDNGYDEAYRRDGAVCLKGVFTPEEVARAFEVFKLWRANVSRPLPYYPDQEGTFFQDANCYPLWPEFEKLFREVPFGDIAAGLFQTKESWFFSNQILVKEGGPIRRTPWHQDMMPGLAGRDFASIWMCFDPVPKENGLEIVRGSHLGPIYSIVAFDPEDDSAPLLREDRPLVPNIEAERGSWDIVSWDMEPGDVLVFHLATLHGGGKTDSDMPRRTLISRFLGEDAWRVEGETRLLHTDGDTKLDEDFDDHMQPIYDIPVGQRLNTNPVHFRVECLQGHA